MDGLQLSVTGPINGGGSLDIWASGEGRDKRESIFLHMFFGFILARERVWILGDWRYFF